MRKERKSLDLVTPGGAAAVRTKLVATHTVTFGGLMPDDQAALQLQQRPFTMPADGPTFIEQVVSRCHSLISCGIWSGFHISKLNVWWNNFHTDTERYFAACLLDKLIYRSEDQTLSLMRQLLQRSLPDHGDAVGGITDWEERLGRSLFDTKVRMIPVIPHGTPQAKSAHIILRMFEKRLNVDKSRLAAAEELPQLAASGVDTILFIDDLLGTGTQFVEEFAIPHHLNTAPASLRLIYAPLVAHQEGLKMIADNVPSVSVVSAEILGPEHAIFGPNGNTFGDSVNSAVSAWNFYRELLHGRGIGTALRGFGDLELAFFFEHATPDNSLPIFWWNNSPQWKPLFHR